MINDFKVIKRGYGVETFGAEDRTTSSVTVAMQPGEPVKRGGSNGNFVIPLATGDPENGTDIFVGIAHKESTETSTLDGEVTVELCGPGTTVEAKATTAANIDTAAKLLGVRGDYVAADVTGAGTNGPTGVFTLDEDEGDDPNVHGFLILGGDIVKGRLTALVAISAFYGNGV
jgi:hypothetical protein